MTNCRNNGNLTLKVDGISGFYIKAKVYTDIKDPKKNYLVMTRAVWIVQNTYWTIV